MLASLSSNSIKQYDVCLKKWFNYSRENSLNFYTAPIPSILSFLTFIFNSGAQYGSLNTYRSALALLIGSDISNDERIKRFFKGVFRLKPPTPKYDVTWDTSIVLDKLAHKYPNRELSLEQLTKKCAMLLALTTAHRMQTLSKIDVRNIEETDSQINIKITDLIKTSRPGHNQPTLYLPFFRQKPEICPANTLLAYLERTRPLRGNNHYLFVSYRKPHEIVGSQSISRWIKSTMGECGVDVSIFSAHSTRHASTSRARHFGLSVDTIRKTAGWSGTSSTFAKFYDRTIISNQGDSLAKIIINV